MMEKLLLLDVSYGVDDVVRNPLVVILFMAIAALLLYFGIRAIRRELKRKKGFSSEAVPMIESEDPETESLPDAEAAPAPDAPAPENAPDAPEKPQDNA